MKKNELPSGEKIGLPILGGQISLEWHWNLKNGDFHISDLFYELFQLHQIKEDAQAGSDDQQPVNIVSLLQNLISHQELAHLKRQLNKLKRLKLSFQSEWVIDFEGDNKKIICKAQPVVSNNEVININGALQIIADSSESDRMTKLAVYATLKSEIPIIITNTNYQIVEANPAAFRALQYTRDQLINQLPIFKIDIENNRKQWGSFFALLKQEKNHLLETSLQRKDGTVFPVELSLLQYKDNLGTLIHIIARDITVRRKAESTLKSSVAEYEITAKELEDEKSYLLYERSDKYGLENIISVNKKYQEVLKKVKQVAPTDATVLITGESGTGKELLARAIHQFSNRQKRTLIKINCATLPRDLIESELFGHEKGAFTGATQQKKGRFELADEGTLFLDEIGEMPLDLQTRLLRVLQEGEFVRIGGTSSIKADVRIIAATNRDLEKMVKEGSFRLDLYYRLHVFPILSIPLRERKEDIPILASFFLKRYAKKTSRVVNRIDQGDIDRLREYDFPGNVRELENIIERAVILSNSETLNLSFFLPNETKPELTEEHFLTLDELQKAHILKALNQTRWKVSGKNGAASLLGINNQTLFSRMRKLGISRKD